MELLDVAHREARAARRGDRALVGHLRGARAWRVTADARRMHRACCVVRCMVHAWCMHACMRTVCAWRVRGGCVAGVGGCNFGASRLQVVRPQLGAGV